MFRKIEGKKQDSENEEEKRRARILKMRKLKLDNATERFQRTPDKKNRYSNSTIQQSERFYSFQATN